MKGVMSILMSAVLMASITVPLTAAVQNNMTAKEWTVVIDAGHGGKDPGTVGSKSKEKNVVLAVALKTGEYIKQNLKDVRVIYTRDDDTFIGLDERAAVANKNKADIFISIHANGMDDRRPYGAESWVLGQSMDDANLKLAMKENSVITFEENYQSKYEGYDPASVESFIIFSLMQNTYLKQSTEFASIIQSQFRERVGRKDRGVKQAGFVVLWRTTMPSVLVELGFISNAEEERYLLSETGQDYMASAIYRAFRDYKRIIDDRSGIQAQISPVKDSVTEKASDKASPGQSPEDLKSVETKSVTVTTETSAEEKNNSPAERDDDILFMVQISAVSKSRAPKQPDFKGTEPVTRIDAGERYKYGAGKFSRFEDAVNYRRTISKDYPDAFVIAVRNGMIIPLKDAVEAKKTKN